MAPDARPAAATPGHDGGQREDYGESVVIDLTDAVAPRALLEAVPDPIILGAPIRSAGGTVEDFRLLYLNAAARALQPRASASIGLSFTEVWAERWWRTPLQASILAVETGLIQRGEVSWTPAGTDEPAGYSYQAVPSGDDTVLFITHDISDRLREARARAVSDNRFKATFDASPAAVVLMDSTGGWQIVSPSFAGLLGSSADALAGRSFADFIDPPDETMAAIDAATLAGIRSDDGDGLVPQRLRAADGQVLWTRVRIRHVPDTGDFVAHVNDVTEDRRTLQELEYEATHDALTGLPNRRYVIDRLGRALTVGQRGAAFGVLLLDLDDFKEVNDRLGHIEGDRLLRDVASRLSSAIRPSDTVARLGGDEFVVVCEGLSSDPAADLLRVADRIQHSLTAWSDDDPGRVVSSTIGIVVGDESYTRPEQLLASADKALYVGKRRGRAQHVIYDPTRDTDPADLSAAGAGLQTGTDGRAGSGARADGDRPWRRRDRDGRPAA